MVKLLGGAGFSRTVILVRFSFDPGSYYKNGLRPLGAAYGPSLTRRPIGFLTVSMCRACVSSKCS